jgi:hypothetical protein
MYHLVRKIHLYCGLIIMVFLMMYFVSGYMMVHRPWFLTPPPPPTIQTATLEPAEAALPAEQLAARVKEKLKLAGRIQFPQNQPAKMTRFWVIRPGAMIRVDVPAGQREARLTTQRVGLVGILIMLHKINGYDDQPLFDVYAAFCDLAGLSMIVFAVSGVYLWWKRTRNKVPGIVCLAVSCAYGVGMMLYLTYAP